MSRPKQLRLKIGDLSFGSALKCDLARMKVLSGYDLDSVELVVKQKSEPYIVDVERAMKNLVQYEANNRHLIPTLSDEQIITKKLLVRMMKISRPTLDRWIDAGFITPLKHDAKTQKHHEKNEIKY